MSFKLISSTSWFNVRIESFEQVNKQWHKFSGFVPWIIFQWRCLTKKVALAAFLVLPCEILMGRLEEKHEVMFKAWRSPKADGCDIFETKAEIEEQVPSYRIHQPHNLVQQILSSNLSANRTCSTNQAGNCLSWCILLWQ